MTRPIVTVNPAVAFGAPQVRGRPTDTIAGMYVAGDIAETVCAEYSLDRHELLLALWYEGAHAGRPGWRQWANEVAYPVLAGWTTADLDALPLPDPKASRVGVETWEDGTAGWWCGRCERFAGPYGSEATAQVNADAHNDKCKTAGQEG